jgi:hypothetical protein
VQDDDVPTDTDIVEMMRNTLPGGERAAVSNRRQELMHNIFNHGVRWDPRADNDFTLNSFI